MSANAPCKGEVEIATCITDCCRAKQAGSSVCSSADAKSPHLTTMHVAQKKSEVLLVATRGQQDSPVHRLSGEIQRLPLRALPETTAAASRAHCTT